MIKTTFCSALIAIGMMAGAQAQLLQFNTAGNTGLETTEPSSANDAGVLTSTLTLGAGITAAANANRLGGTNYFDTGDTNPTTLAESVTGNDYFEFTLTPVTGAAYTVTSFVFGFDHSATGPNALTLRSSRDGYTADLGSVTALAASQTNGNTITIAGLANLTTATTFRIYGYGATAAAGSGGFDTTATATTANVVLNGTTTVPEPATYAYMLGGLGLLVLVVRRRQVA